MERVNGVSKFLIISNNLSNDYDLPRYQAELVVARASGAMTMADLMRKIKLGIFVGEPSLYKILETMKKLDFAPVAKKGACNIAPNEKVFYTLVRC
ncbi:hypothetical protein [Vibrio crassostreae]|uniref:hypothetical protein n=1 Tax=Vibrio crassostreae TaxID=246167 RepID=UPI001B3050D8|nr:hypothetical protein [Vibrio crassostreae]CAK2585781.1 conserved hypothetical protein [Vibrio crassostreae]CAK3768448.1 conserved hypothetical protein [Vibrio crassostreae]CAK3782036.1 conserved hypothetical protein [Vibrio crassostreae]